MLNGLSSTLRGHYKQRPEYTVTQATVAGFLLR